MVKNIMFWANVTSYIDRLISGDYELERALQAAALKYHVNENEILQHCKIDTSKVDPNI